MSISEGSPQAKPQANAKDPYRLPTNVRPTHYDLIIKTDLGRLTFEGQAIIQLEVKKESTSIVFNLDTAVKIARLALVKIEEGDSSHSEYVYDVPAPASDEEIDTPAEANLGAKQSSVRDLSGVKPGDILYDRVQKRVALGLPEDWSVNPSCKLLMKVTWSADLNNSMRGYYKAAWKKNGEDAYYAMTQFESTEARRAYPSWDEPAVKSTYSIAMVSRAGIINLSNMPAVEEKPWLNSIELENGVLGEGLSEGTEGNWAVTLFQKTPLISSYLVAWASGEFVHLESQYVSPLSGAKIPLRIYATSDNIGKAQLALDVKAKAMPIYEQLFDIEYPLPKLDTLVASEFDSGAMENWGLITGRASCLLWDSEKSTFYDRKLVAEIQCHECAHMWFGNIVSPEWWTYLWLNEAFATLMGEIIVPEKIFPEFNVRQEFLTGSLMRALNLDALRSSHPIEVDCPDALLIDSFFDSISYYKGASVLRMLASVVGEETFLKGVSIYLKKRLFGHSITRDLWVGITEASGINVSEIMEGWILKVGFPVITVEELDNGRKLKVRQNRFLTTGDVLPEEDETLWFVPLALKTVKPDGAVWTDHKAILRDREAIFDIGATRAFKLNAETVGVYRVAYSPARLSSLGEEASKSDTGFTVEDRIGLVSDAMTLAAAGHGRLSGALTLIFKLSNEREMRVWESIATSLATLHTVWWEQPEDIRMAIDKFRIKLFRPVIDRLGWDFQHDEDPAQLELRVLALRTMADSGDGLTIAEMQRRFQPFLSSGDDSLMPADLRGIICKAVVRHGGELEYRKMRQVLDGSPNAVMKLEAIQALGSTNKIHLVHETLAMITAGSILDQDVSYAFRALSSNRIAIRETVEYFQDNYDALMKRFGDNFAMNRIIPSTYERLTTEEDVINTQAFFEGKNVEKFKMPLAQALDKMRSSIRCLANDGEDVRKWLKDNACLD